MKPALRARLEQHRDCAVGALAELRRSRFGATLNLIALAMAAIFPLVLHVALQNAFQFATALGETRQIAVFLKPEIALRDAQALARDIARSEDVARVAVKEKDSALQELQRQLGFAELRDLLPDNPLPHVLLVVPRRQAQSEFASIAERVQSLPGVEIAQFDLGWHERLDAILGLLGTLSYLLSLIFALGACLIIANVLRLEMNDKKEEIAVLELLGATRAHIRRPFLYKGAYYGAAGALLGCAAVVALQWIVGPKAQSLLQAYDSAGRFSGLGPTAISMAALAGTALGLLVAWSVVSYRLGPAER